MSDSVAQALPQLMQLLQAGQGEQAVARARTLLRNHPHDPRLRFALSNLLRETGAVAEALTISAALVKEFPQQPQALFVHGMNLRADGAGPKALPVFEQLAALDANNPEAHFHLAATRHQCGHVEQALHGYQGVLEQAPGFLPARNNLAVAARELGRLSDAEAQAREVLTQDPRNAMAHNTLGLVSMDRGEVGAARHAFEQALAIEPRNPDFHYNLGLSFAMQGDFATAGQHYQAALQAAPARVDILKEWVQFDTSAEVAEQIENLARHANELTAAQRGDLMFAVGKVRARSGNAAQAFAAYQQANAARAETLGADHFADFEAYANALLKCEPRETVAGAASSAPRPIFILGMPRSGTTLVDQILCSHSEVTSGGELDYFERALRASGCGLDQREFHAFEPASLTPEKLSACGKHYRERLKELNATTRFVTDKQLSNFLHAGLIGAALPEAIIVHCTRDPLDNALSCFFTDFDDWHYFSHALEKLGRFYAWQEKLMQHWQAFLGDRLVQVNYETLVSDFDAQAHQLVEACGLEWQEQCARFHESDSLARTASIVQVREKPHSRSVGTAQKYLEEMRPFSEALARARKELGA